MNPCPPKINSVLAKLTHRINGIDLIEANKIEIKKKSPFEQWQQDIYTYFSNQVISPVEIPLGPFTFEATIELDPAKRDQFFTFMDILKPNQENNKKMTNTPLSTQEKIEALQVAISTLPLLDHLNEQQVRLFCRTLAEQNDHVFFYSDWV